MSGLLSAYSATAQGQPAKDWYQQNTTKKNMGIDLYDAYDELLKGKTASEIVVAVIDGGTDVAHPDLIKNIWHNPGEIPFNNIDDDGNGYTDDTVGWNFIGGADGGMVEYDNLEMTRLYRKLTEEFEDMDAEDIAGNPAQVARYELYQEVKKEVKMNKTIYSSYLEGIESAKKVLDRMKESTGKEDPTVADLEKFEPATDREERMKKGVIKEMESGRPFSALYGEIKDQYDQVKAFAEYHYNVDYECRGIVGDNYSDSREKHYGNNNVAGPDAGHGTHVAGIIAATRDNNIGMNGISNARIMVVRVVPNGDERDKDVANGIRYAVDNGAKIINMSFGKSYKWDKAVVDEAVAYAVSKGVLLIHAAGNDAKNTDVENNFPNDKMENGSSAETWVEVGASAPPVKKLPATFSNYGQTNVDVFAPGYQIYSTIPEEKYAFFDGTSMAAPVTSGVAALVWSYYPTLTAKQVKQILMESAVVVKKKTPIPGDKDKAKFTSLSVTGGVVNAYKALQLAEKMVSGK